MSESEGEGSRIPPRSLADPLPEPADGIVIRHAEEVASASASGWRGVGFLKARTRVDRTKVDRSADRLVETAEIERVPVGDGDSQRIETLPDGSISIPIFEEELVVTKRVVLKERVILRKQVETVTERIQDELRIERVEIEADDAVSDRVNVRD